MNKRLMDQRIEAETAISAQHNRLSTLEEQITKSLTDKKDRELNKDELERTTTNMQDVIKNETQKIAELKASVIDIKKDIKGINEEYKSEDSKLSRFKTEYIKAKDEKKKLD